MVDTDDSEPETKSIMKVNIYKVILSTSIDFKIVVTFIYNILNHN